jgi:hypothetical protein
MSAAGHQQSRPSRWAEGRRGGGGGGDVSAGESSLSEGAAGERGANALLFAAGASPDHCYLRHPGKNSEKVKVLGTLVL